MPRGKLLNGLVTQQKVLRAAVALFLEKGYTRTTTGEIAKAAGIGQSSFFHVFPSKEALLLDMVDYCAAHDVHSFSRGVLQARLKSLKLIPLCPPGLCGPLPVGG